MKTACYACVALILTVLAGCAAHKSTVFLPLPAAPLGLPLVAQFGARLNIGGQTAPLQGEVQMTAQGGSLALILPHGKTLGICTYGPDFGAGTISGTSSGTEPKGARGHTSVKMHCTPAEGMGREAANLLTRSGVAVYRMLPALGPGAIVPKLEGDGWSAQFSPSADGSSANGAKADGSNAGGPGADALQGAYVEQDGMRMDVYFVEISHL